MPAKWCTLTPRVHARGVVLRILVLGKETHFFYCGAPSAQVWVPAQIWVPPCRQGRAEGCGCPMEGCGGECEDGWHVMGECKGKGMREVRRSVVEGMLGKVRKIEGVGREMQWMIRALWGLDGEGSLMRWEELDWEECGEAVGGQQTHQELAALQPDIRTQKLKKPSTNNENRFASLLGDILIGAISEVAKQKIIDEFVRFY